MGGVGEGAQQGLLQQRYLHGRHATHVPTGQSIGLPPSLRRYDLCEVTAVRVDGGSEAYLEWVRSSTEPAAGDGSA